MEVIKIEPTDETPGVEMDASSGQFVFTGKSLPEDVTVFYTPILEWLELYEANPASSTMVEFKMDYFNTASSKLILDILLKLEEIAASGNDITVKWHHREDDEDMEEAGEEYGDIIEVDFELHSY